MCLSRLPLGIRRTHSVALPVMCCFMPSRRVPDLLSSRTELQFCSWELRVCVRPGCIRIRGRKQDSWGRRQGIVGSGSYFRFVAFEIAVDTRWAAMTTQVLLTSPWHASEVADGFGFFPTRREELHILNRISLMSSTSTKKLVYMLVLFVRKRFPLFSNSL